MNKKEFDLSGITRWHELGYTGKGIRIANMEGTDRSVSSALLSCTPDNIRSAFAASIRSSISPSRSLPLILNAVLMSSNKIPITFFQRKGGE